ncbi:transmembrane protein [Coleophoma crateriformis]|uniref:Transmembrane protein n=1 Tax=Coleophoma crateriformis TaxID=565419 RepID=A0A3D8S9B0_9HELO|nr:transmembrane protein [Coleophoma crateriformis]
MRVQLRNLPISALRLLTSLVGRALIVSVACWLVAFQYCRYAFWRNPHSAFFQSEHVYDLQYSNYRKQQALEYIADNGAEDTPQHNLASPPEVCAAFVTVKREIQYVEAAIGSLLEGLTGEERENLHAYVLFANSDPTIHPTYSQPWLRKMVDSAEGYNVSVEVLDHLRELEAARNFYEKGVFDYTYALDHCYQVGSPYIVMLEDDIILADGWMAKARQALLEVEAQSHEEKRNWIYLRLFYTETSMSWQDTDFWYGHMPFTFLLAVLATFCSLILVRINFPSSRRHLDNWTVLALSAVSTPAFVALLFMVGKYSLFPPLGVFELNKYGCCTQALVFPRPEVPALTKYLRGIGTGQTDTMIENYADQQKLGRFALAPQQAQHVGLQSSRDNTLINSQSTWAFSFETYDPQQLKAEHKALVGG